MKVGAMSAKMEAEDLRERIWKHEAEDSYDNHVDFLLE